jgi:hypothetical protein
MYQKQVIYEKLFEAVEIGFGIITIYYPKYVDIYQLIRDIFLQKNC